MSEVGHRGAAATLERLKPYCAWPGMEGDFEYLQLGRAEGQKMFEAETGYEYMLVLVEDISGFAWLEPARSCTADMTARTLIKWCALMGAPRVWVSDGAAHFKNGLLTMLAEALAVEHHFSVAHSAWTNGTAERFNTEIIQTAKAILSEQGRPI